MLLVALCTLALRNVQSSDIDQERDLMKKPRFIAECVEFLHDAVHVRKNAVKGGEELFVNAFIPMGTVLIVERPMIWQNFEAVANAESIEQRAEIASALSRQIQKRRQTDRAFADILDHELVHSSGFYQQAKSWGFDNVSTLDFAKYLTNDIGGGLFAVSAKMNHGYPTTVKVHTARTQDGTGTNFVFATDDLQPGTPLEWDYFDYLCATPRQQARHGFSALDGVEDADLIEASVLQYKESGGDLDLMLRLFHDGIVSRLYRNCYFAPIFDAMPSLRAQDEEMAAEFEAAVFGCTGDERKTLLLKQMANLNLYSMAVTGAMKAGQIPDWMGPQFKRAMLHKYVASLQLKTAHNVSNKIGLGAMK